MIEPDQLRRWKREVQAMIDHASHDDPEGFAEIVHLLDAATSKGLRYAAQRLRETNGSGQPGYSWAELARPLGLSKQSVAERFNRTIEPEWSAA